MISSMTGYGKGSVQIGEFVIETEIKSFNNRFLDLSVKLPKNFSHKEFEVREKVKNRIKRGKVYLSVYISRDGNENKNIPLNKEGLEEAVALVKEIKDAAGIKSKLKINDLMNFQHLFFAETFLDEEEDFIHVENAVDEALKNLEEMRLKEGNELKSDIAERVKNIEKTVGQIEEISTSSIVEYFDKLKERAKQLTSEILDNPERLNAELALLSERYDVTEESVRLKSHIKMFLDALNNSEEVGRKLNFISQEMNREANTINSKTVSTEISQYGIYIKEELEKIREQIQNIE